MSEYQRLQVISSLNRRQLLRIGLVGVGLAGAAIACQKLRSWEIASSLKTPSLPSGLPNKGNAVNPMVVCRDFDYGTIKQENGRTVREFQIVANTTVLELNQAVSFSAWTYNGRVPGPTLRAREGERLRVVFFNRGGHSHSMHFHGIHSSDVDGIKPVRNNTSIIYEFDTVPYGLHIYHVKNSRGLSHNSLQLRLIS